MKKLFIPAVALALTVLAIFVLFKPVFAWNYEVSGEVKCEQGEWKATWTIDNSSESQALHVLSSDRAAVPTGDVPAYDKATYTETITSDTTLTITGNWDGDQAIRTRSASVVLVGECEKPEVPVTPQVPPEIKQLPNTSIKE